MFKKIDQFLYYIFFKFNFFRGSNIVMHFTKKSTLKNDYFIDRTDGALKKPRGLHWVRFQLI